MVRIINYNSIKLTGEVLPEGRFATVYTGEFEGEPVAVKVYDKSHKRNRYKLLGVWDNATDEFRKLELARRVAPEVLDNLQAPIGVSQSPRGDRILVSRLVTDYDGSVSQNLEVCKRVSSQFIDRLKYVVDCFHHHDLYILDMTPANILLRRDSENESSPVLIDFQRFNDLRFYIALAFGIRLGIDSKLKKDQRRLKRTLDSLVVMNESRTPQPK